MDAAIALDSELGNGNGNCSGSTVADMVDATHDATKLPRVMVTGGVAEAAAALYLALFRTPAGLFVRTNSMFYSYYGVLVAVLLFGLMEAWAGLWVSHDPLSRRAVGMTVLCVSLLPLLFLAAVAGHAMIY
ncbi:hypothetical protein QYE76_045959 [Lolium multiflorum]|uniref:Uncharacterized protein n=1 Tax=Lolium multiflorum TaxID=4521 RepID=A0AAD8X097_LOLMU|nr:hypothetical protein QYE76_045959 [Lolium multiflorum]